MNTLQPLLLHPVHVHLGAHFGELRDFETVVGYGDSMAEYEALKKTAAVLDFSFRGRGCLTGADRVRLLHGQVSNDVQKLRPGEGCYAALVTVKGRMQADLNIHVLENELLLDFEPGLTSILRERFEHYIVAEDVQFTDVAPFYGLVSIQGPLAEAVMRRAVPDLTIPKTGLSISYRADPSLGDLYLVNHARTGGSGFDFYVSTGTAALVFDKLVAAARAEGGRPAGFEAFEWARIEAGIPRFGVDMDEGNLPPETGIETRAISYNKGCYIGQEVIARIRTYGQVARALRGLRLDPQLSALPVRGDKLFLGEREVGNITSAIHSPEFGMPIALGYVRREANTPGTALRLRTRIGEFSAEVVALPF